MVAPEVGQLVLPEVGRLVLPGVRRLVVPGVGRLVVAGTLPGRITELCVQNPGVSTEQARHPQTAIISSNQLSQCRVVKSIHTASSIVAEGLN